MNVTGTMQGHLLTVPNVTKTLQANQAYLSIRAQTAEQVRAQRVRDEEWNLRTQNLFLNQCLILDYRVRATERAMNETGVLEPRRSLPRGVGASACPAVLPGLLWLTAEVSNEFYGIRNVLEMSLGIC
ncbi:hypothetical protein ACU4GD_01395 [Cupriavidus basilensis]